MKIILNIDECTEIEVGDLVSVDGLVGIVVDMSDEECIKGGGPFETVKLEFPFKIININNGLEIYSYYSLENINKDCKLVGKNNNITLTINHEI